MKIAYLLLAHNDPQHLKYLIETLNTPNSYFYIHIDKKSTENFPMPIIPNIHLIRNQISANWGGFSVTQSILNTLAHAYANKASRYILLSGQDYPIKTNFHIQEFFNKHPNTDFINSHPMPQFDKPFSRLNKYYFEYNVRQRSLDSFIKSNINLIFQNIPYTRNLPAKYRHFELYAGSTWWALTHSSVSKILKFLDNNPAFLNHFRHTLLADEMFFQLIIRNVVKSKISPSLTYHNWSFGGPPYPALLTMKHLKDIQKKEQKEKQPYLFARKINSSNSQVREFINKYYLGIA